MVDFQEMKTGVDLGRGFVIKNPIMTASGTFGYSFEYARFYDVKKLGAIVTKAITLEPRDGNSGRRIFETCGGMINRIGLENVGVKRFMAEKLPLLNKGGLDFVVNLAGSSLEEYISLAKICEEHKIRAIELNVSCPNVKSGCLEFGTDEKTLHNLVSQVRDEFSGCLIVKLTPNVTSVEKIAVAAQSAGADAVSAINTLKGTGIKLNWHKGKFIKEEVTGGLSGRAIKPVALGVVSRISKVLDIPIIGMGGIYDLNDVFEFLSAGAAAVQVGTANFTHPECAGCIADDLHDFMYENGIRSIEDLKEKLRGE